MSNKLARNVIPAGHTRNDFECFGPVATTDDDFVGKRMIDMGCFNQDSGVDSNKYYHAAVVKSKKTGQWCAYFEWGKTKPDGRSASPAFLFVECSSEAEAEKEFISQAKSKNISRGTWEKIGSKPRLVPKVDSKGVPKDLYVVRPLAKRLVGLPEAENVTNNDAQGAAKSVAPTAAKKTAKKSSNNCPKAERLFADLIGGAVTYSKAFLGSKGGAVTLPTQQALNDGREILNDALIRVGIIGDDINAQVNDKTLNTLTKTLLGMIPKNISGVGPDVWMLTKNNISIWQLDIDTLETALQAEDMDAEVTDSSVMDGIPAKIEWVDPSEEIYQWLIGSYDGKKHTGFWPTATRYRSGTGRSELKFHGLYRIVRSIDKPVMRKTQEQYLKEMPSKWNEERPMFHDKKRPDLDAEERKLFWNTNTNLLWHGTRSVNVPGIVRENLRFPKELSGVAITGAMFGPGSYFADDWSKSAGYCSSPHSMYGGSGSVKGRKSFMFAFDVALGNPFVAPGPKGYAGPPTGHHCVFGKAGHSGVQNNEWIVYRKGCIDMRYLAEIEW